VSTPLADTPATFIDSQQPLVIVPILRAGLALLEGGQDLLPLPAATYHFGVVRHEQTLEPSCYLNKFPTHFSPSTRVLLFDPMLATGGSIMLALEELVKRGIDPAFVRIIGVVAAPPALQKLGSLYPSVVIYTATIDEGLNSQGYIVPGLGDAGDRAFATMD
jgi:uracil phosphoribosyltransferase